MSGRGDVMILHASVSLEDVTRALRRAGFAVTNDKFKSLHVIEPLTARFPCEPNVIDMTVPSFLRRQAGPERDIKGIDFDVPGNSG